MKIEKILNNNVLITLDYLGHEQIIMGKGIAFNKKKGDTVDSSLIEKQFILTNHELLPKFAQLLSEIPMEIVIVSELIINYARDTLGKTLQDIIYISLTDHIHFAIERHKQGLDIPNSFLLEIKKFYPNEFKIGQFALDTIKTRLNIVLPDDEAGFIAFHLVNSQLNDSMSTIVKMTKTMNEILDIVKMHFRFEYNEDSLTYLRFISHLKFFSQRIINQNFTQSEDISLYIIAKEKYSEAYLCTKKIDDHLSKYYQHKLTEDEKLYLTLHIERLRSELNKN